MILKPLQLLLKLRIQHNKLQNMRYFVLTQTRAFVNKTNDSGA